MQITRRLNHVLLSFYTIRERTSNYFRKHVIGSNVFDGIFSAGKFKMIILLIMRNSFFTSFGFYLLQSIYLFYLLLSISPFIVACFICEIVLLFFKQKCSKDNFKSNLNDGFERNRTNVIWRVTIAVIVVYRNTCISISRQIRQSCCNLFPANRYLYIFSGSKLE